MTDITNTSIGIIILLLRLGLVLLLYLFLWQVLHFVIRDLRQAGRTPASAARSQFGELVVVRTGQSTIPVGKTFPLGPSNIIGRSMEHCEVALNDSFLSAQHARLELRGDSWVLEDMHSTNGTFVNEIEVRDPTILEDGDVIRVGRVEMRLMQA